MINESSSMRKENGMLRLPDCIQVNNSTLVGSAVPKRKIDRERTNDPMTIKEAMTPEDVPLSLFCPNVIRRNPRSGKAGIKPASCII